MEKQQTHSTVVFKNKGQPAPAAGEAASHPRRFRLLVACLATLSIFLLLSVSANIYMATMMNERTANLEAELGNMTAENQQLLSERSFLQSDLDNLTWTMGVILAFSSFPVSNYCPQKQYAECHQCQSGWIQFQESCYLFSVGIATWADSRKSCQGQAADLVVIDSLEEQIFVTNNTKLYSDVWHGYWMGLYQTADNTWHWIDGSNVTLQFWLRNITGMCGQTMQLNNYTANWSPAQCSQFNGLICEGPVLKK